MPGSLWVVSGSYYNKTTYLDLYETTRDGSITSSFDTHNFAAGVGLNQQDSIWHSYNQSSIYKFDQSGSVLKSFASPSNRPWGVATDTDDCIWNVQSCLYSIYKFDESGSTITTFSDVASGPRGLGITPDECLWHADSDSSSIYKFDQSGSVLKSFASPSAYPTGVGGDSDGCLWIADSQTAMVYKTNQDGSEIASFAAPSEYAFGVGPESTFAGGGGGTTYTASLDETVGGPF